MLKSLKNTALILALSIMCLHQANAESGPIHINTNDTVAGYSTSFKTSKINPEREIIFRVKKPDNSIVEIPATTDELGYADANFLGFHTKKAGIYQVLAFYKDENFENAPKTAFSVYAGEVSEVSSKITSEPPSLEANNKDTSLLKISLKDTYSNPVSNHNVLVISSRPDDIIQNVSESSGTDEKGVSYFHLSSKKAGISYITVIDQTTNKVLEDREKIIFFEPETEKPMGGNLYQANMFATSSSSDDSNSQPTNFSADEELFGPIDHFDIDFPNKVKVGSDQNNLKITAKDKQGRIVKSYTGTIIISTPDDENATLPGDGKYTFQPRDQGERTFDLALIFAKSGRQAIEVYDFDADEGVISDTIKGEKIVEVTDAEFSGGAKETSSDAIQIKKPAEGSKSGTSTLTIVGKARPNTDLKIFIDDVKISEVGVDSDGMFSKEITNIEDGSHAIFVREAEGSQETSPVVNFFIDTTPPPLNEVKLNPSEPIKEGENLTIEVYSIPELDKAQIVAGSITETLIEDFSEAGKYSITIKAPENPGEYPLDITLVDELQNKAQFKNATTIKIIPKEEPKKTEVKDFKVNINSNTAKLTWSEIKDIPEDASQIKISYGKNKLYLKQTELTTISSKELEIKELDFDQDYFFTLIVIDQLKNELYQSEIISSKTEKEPIHEIAEPEEEVVAPAPNEFFATEGSGRVFLRWTKDQYAASYELKINVYGTNYFESREIGAASTSTIIEDLINGQTYAFMITPKDINGFPTGSMYPVIFATPNWDGTHPTPTPLKIQEHTPPRNEQVGAFPKEIFLSSLFFMAGLYLFRKSFILTIK